MTDQDAQIEDLKGQRAELQVRFNAWGTRMSEIDAELAALWQAWRQLLRDRYHHEQSCIAAGVDGVLPPIDVSAVKPILDRIMDGRSGILPKHPRD